MPSFTLGYVGVLVIGMVITGATNSLFTKYQDMQCVKDCDTDHPVVFEQPVWQTLQMFLGEMLCFLPILYTIIRRRLGATTNGVQLPTDDELEDVHQPFSINKPVPLTGRRIALLWIPAFCDLTGTTLMNIGLIYTPVSIYQMTRGSLVLFVGIFSVTFLRRKLWAYQWAALVAVMLGVSIVGLSGSMIKESHQVPGGVPGEEQSLNLTIGESFVAVSKVLVRALKREEDVPKVASVIVGVFFIVFAQIFTATQFVVEESLLSKYSVDPLVAVGYEGLSGTISVLLLLPILSLTPLRNLSTYFDLREGWNQIISTPSVRWTSIAIAFSIALFNGFGLSVTRHLSATARSVIDSCRTLLIWIVSVFIGWEFLVFPTSLLQLGGFGMLVYGTFLFNNLIAPPSILAPPEHYTPDVTIDAPTAPTSAQLEEAREEAEAERRALLSEE